MKIKLGKLRSLLREAAGGGLTAQEVDRRWPEAIMRLIDDYTFTQQEDPQGFIDQFGVASAKELVWNVLQFHEVPNDKPYSTVQGETTVAFTEPNLGTNVESVWIGDEWEA